MRAVLQQFVRLSGLALLLGLLNQCGSALTVTDEPDPDISNVTAAIAEDVGAVNQVIVDDTLTYMDFLAGNLEQYIEDNFGAPGQDDGRFVVRFVVDTQDDEVSNIEITQDPEPCDVSGTKQLVGNLTMTLQADSSAGSLEGTYNVLYTDCAENVLLTTDSGSCTVETLINGTMDNTIAINFSELNTYLPDQYETHNAIVTNANDAITFANGEEASQGLTYDFTAYVNTNSSTPDLDGDLTFSGTNYEVSDVVDFVEAANADDICPTS